METRESDDYLYHYTTEYSSLINIMIEKFKPFYCVEDLSFIYGESNQIMAFPIVCFSDIPYERHSNHKSRYGNYGIGLTKDWGIRNHLSLVNYSHKMSLAASSIRILINNYISNPSSDIRIALSLFLISCKPYEGKLYDKSGNILSTDDVRFYDEKEWRYIPQNYGKRYLSISLKECGCQMMFKIKIKIETHRIQKNNKLDFDVSDLKIIKLNSMDEKRKFISDIIKSKKYTDTEMSYIESIIQ